ncbi:hypothetical protein [Streptomyces sp. NPDC056683]|uniref:hypothetical protein n=1 Tax=Streptomyces sp. NPDC056683 TaxID=3345910 RepID=UPI0036925D01
MLNPSFAVKALLVIACALVSILVAIGAGLLARTSGAPLTQAAFSAGGPPGTERAATG